MLIDTSLSLCPIPTLSRACWPGEMDTMIQFMNIVSSRMSTTWTLLRVSCEASAFWTLTTRSTTRGTDYCSALQYIFTKLRLACAVVEYIVFFSWEVFNRWHLLARIFVLLLLLVLTVHDKLNKHFLPSFFFFYSDVGDFLFLLVKWEIPTVGFFFLFWLKRMTNFGSWTLSFICMLILELYPTDPPETDHQFRDSGL